jgi:diguanylate cyclase (GGDEF)-like protein
LILYNNRKKINQEELFTLSLLSVIPGVLSTIQLFYFVYLTIWNSVAIAVMINYIFIINNRTMVDPLTRLGNRLAYIKYIASLRGNGNIVLSVINIDLDNFKTINDLWGHDQGDEVLKAFAGQLKNVFEKGVLIRWGGDEFIVLLNENRREVLEQYLKTLSDRVNKYNERNDLPYEISFSYGLAIFNNSYRSVDDLIRHSDKLMYEKKHKKATGSLPIRAKL